MIREARRRQHRRWTVGVLSLITASALVLVLVWATGGQPPGTNVTRSGVPKSPASSLASSVVNHTTSARSADFSFVWQTPSVLVRGSGTVNFVAPSYAIKETFSGLPQLAGSVDLTRTPSGAFYQQTSGEPPMESSGNGLMPGIATSATGTGPLAILSRGPAGFSFGLLELIPAKDLRLVRVGSGEVGGTRATTYLFSDSGNCHGTVQTRAWTAKDGRLLRVTTTQFGAHGRLGETMSLTFTRFGVPVSISPPSGAVASPAAGNPSINENRGQASSFSVQAVPICTP